MNSLRITERARRIDPFYVMEVAKAAREMDQTSSAGSPPMIYLNIGEPDFTAAPLVQQAAEKALRDGLTQYTPALGLMALRERISQWYQTRFGLQIPASRIVVTAGASAALQLACLALIEQGDEILMPDPCYPCNRHFVSSAQGRPVLLATTPQQRFSLSLQSVQQAWGPATRGILLASPSNPTGTSIEPGEMHQLLKFVHQRGGINLIDEIYLGLSYDDYFGQSALALPGDLGQSVISINSFSKYFSMTGWRLGWMVLPPELVPVIERLAQNLFICPSSIAQHAALACFEPESLAEFERRRTQFRQRRDYFLPALERLGLKVPVRPDGAFYAYADASAVIERLGLPAARPDGTGGSWDLAFELMKRARVVVTPGRDFGQADSHRYLRFSTASRMAELEEAVARLERVLG